MEGLLEPYYWNTRPGPLHCGLTPVSDLFRKLTGLLIHWGPVPLIRVGLEVKGHNTCLPGKAAPIHGS